MEYKFKLSKIHCAGCAVALEQNLNEIEGVRAEISFVSKQLRLFIDTENPAETLTAVKIAVTNFDHAIELYDYGDEDKLEEKEKNQRIINVCRYSFSIIALILGLFIEIMWLKVIIFAFSYGASSYDVIWGAIQNIRNKNIFDEKLLMSVASIGAFVIGEFVEAIFE